MSTNRKITIFLASSEELINDRNSFHSLISTLDDIYEDRGIRIKLKRWEDFFAFCTGTRTQDDYNKVLSASDMCICLFHKRAGQYTIEEFKHAVAEYQRTGDHPKTYVYARALVEGEIEEEELKQFKDELFQQMGHYWCNYATEDSMKLHFIMQFERLINDMQDQREESKNLSIEQGNVMLHGRKVADYNNIPFAANNDEVKALKEKIAALDKDIVMLRSLGNDMLLPMINEKVTERNKCLEDLEKLEKQLLDTALSISKMISSGNPISERKRAAIEMFEQGNNKGVLDMLNEEDIERDYQSAKRELQAGQALIDAGEKAKEAAREKIRSLVEELQLKADTWMSTYSEPNRFEEACKCYEKAIAHTRESLTEEELATRLHDYGKFLYQNNQYHLAEPYYLEALKICKKNNSTNTENSIFLYIESIILVSLALLQSKTNRYEEAEEHLCQAIEIQNRLIEIDPDAFLIDLTESMFHLASIYAEGELYDEAEECYKELIAILYEMEEVYPKKQLFPLSSALGNLGRLYLDIQRYKDAQNYCQQALKIRKEFADNNPKYLPQYAETLRTSANIYYHEKNFKEAERLQLQILEIRQQLVNRYPKEYLPKLAVTLLEIANIYSQTNRIDDAEKYYHRALEIRQSLAEDNPDAQLSSISLILKNLAILHQTNKNTIKAESYYIQSLKIRMQLATKSPRVHWKEVSEILERLACLYVDLKRFSDAKFHYKKLLELYEQEVSFAPEIIRKNMADTMMNLADLYYETNNLKIAEEYCIRSLNLYQELSEKTAKPVLQQMVCAMGRLACLYKETQRPKEAADYFKQALAVLSSQPDEEINSNQHYQEFIKEIHKELDTLQVNNQ